MDSGGGLREDKGHPGLWTWQEVGIVPHLN